MGEEGESGRYGESNMEPELMAKQELNLLRRKSEKTGKKGETDSAQFSSVQSLSRVQLFVTP